MDFSSSTSIVSGRLLLQSLSIGMWSGDLRAVLDGRLFSSRQAVFDIVYKRRLELLRDARAAGAVALDGVMMRVYQGARALEIWTGKKAPADVM